ncbi:MAG: hypothetical protein U5N86_06405 [Planctomycetota bacterium]|nr:hypothetical protein [Planctomycetota bacterium]
MTELKRRTEPFTEGIRFYYSSWFKLVAAAAAVVLLSLSVRVSEGGLEMSNPWLLFSGAVFAVLTCALTVLPYLTISGNEMRIYVLFKTRRVKLDAVARFVREKGGSITVYTGTGVKYRIYPLCVNSSERKSLVDILGKIAPFDDVAEDETGEKE